MATNVTTNTTASNNQTYGINIDTTNSEAVDLYGYQDIVFDVRSGEGVLSGQLNGEDKFITSRQIIKTLDLLSEGEIEGLVSGEYTPEGNNPTGQLGYESCPFKAYGAAPEAFLRSVYLNDTPVVNKDNQYNFQTLEFALFNGAVEGIQEDDDFLNVGEANHVEKTRIINERIYGPDLNLVDEDDEDDPGWVPDPVTGGNAAEPFFYHPKTYRIFNKHLSKIRINLKINALSYTKQGAQFELDDIGDTVGSKLTFKFRYRPLYYNPDSGIVDFDADSDWYGTGGLAGGGIPYTSKVEGLIRSAYMHKFEIQPAAALKKDNLAGWEIEIVRITLDSIQSNIQNETYVDAITHIFEDTLSYRSSAVAAMSFNAEFFSSVPTRAFDLRLLKVKIPTGYDPICKQYNEDTPWDGTFQKNDDGTYNLQWTDNPAWIYYDLLSNKRYGLAKHLGLGSGDLEVDKWTLYEISRFCDILVPDGKGGTEPRFTANTLINTREDAYKVLKDFASVFRAVTYYGLGSIHAVQDRPKPEVAQFTNSNVLNGDFFYSSTSQKARPTVALVRYNDPTNLYKGAIEYVEDSEGIRKHGVKEKEVTAFACTSRAQAIRVGRWILATDSAQGEAINFTVGPEGMMLRPGDIVRVTDQNRSDYNSGGRVVNHSYHEDAYHTSGILLDRELTFEDNKSYTLYLTTPSYFYDTSLVSGLDTSHTADIRKPHLQSFQFDQNNSSMVFRKYELEETIVGTKYGTFIGYTELPSDGKYMFENSNSAGSIIDDATWSVLDNDYSDNLYNVISTSEEEPLRYKVQAIVHEPRKYDYVDKGTPYSFVPAQLNNTVAPPGPKDLTTALVAYNSATEDTKKITIKVHRPTNSDGDVTSETLGTTIGYKVYVKEGAWTDADMVPNNASRPKGTFFFRTVFLTDLVDPIDGNPVTYYIPPRNNKTYYFRAFAINSTSIMSSAYEDSSTAVTNHYPIRDIKIHSLRLLSTSNVANPSANKTLFNQLDNKDFAVEWKADFLNEVTISLPIRYRVSVHEPSPTSTPSTEIANYLVSDQDFNFSFLVNASTNGGPRRHVDIVVQAMDEEGNLSASALDPSSDAEGWDIIEILNPKPIGFNLTPRKDNGKRPGDHIVCNNKAEAITTEQYIDADGNIVLKTLINSFADLAGGYVYISKHPFSGNDFNDVGVPKALADRPNIQLASHESFKAEDYIIQEIPFEAEGGTLLPSKIVVSPPAAPGTSPSDVFNYGSAYYMAVKFYDSFDREIKRQETPPSDWNDDAWIGFARDHHPAGGDDNDTYVGYYEFSSLSSGLYVGIYDVGVPSCTTGTFGCPIWPTKYFSASAENGFKYWIRINVNGQWEGNGISHVRAFTHKDQETLYDFQGYYEYSCYMSESMVDDYIEPNSLLSHTRCRFRQGQEVAQEVYDVDNQYIYYGPWYHGKVGYATSFVTGATRPPDGIDPTRQDAGDPTERYWQPLPRAGIPYGGWGRTYTSANAPDYASPAGAVPSVDKIDSVNWRNQKVEGKSRPLFGFRRFRVYFDPKNLPPKPAKDQLSAYAVIGMNSWNGAYESWPGNRAEDIAKSLLTIKDEVSSSSLAGTYPVSVRSWIQKGDLFENVPGVWNHHPAGFGAGFGGLIKNEGYFDVHMGRLIDDSYLNEAFFGVVATNDYSLLDSTVRTAGGFDQQTGLHEATWSTDAYITLSENDGTIPYPGG